jgi:hypothetical protein
MIVGRNEIVDAERFVHLAFAASPYSAFASVFADSVALAYSVGHDLDLYTIAVVAYDSAAYGVAGVAFHCVAGDYYERLALVQAALA